jgi:hypothetical protein
MSKVGWIESPYGKYPAGPEVALRYASYCMSCMYLNYNCDFVYIAPHMCYGHLPQKPLAPDNQIEKLGEESVARATCWYEGKSSEPERDFSAIRKHADVVFFFVDLGVSPEMRKSIDECEKTNKKMFFFKLKNLSALLAIKPNKDDADQTLLGFLIQKEKLFPDD